MIELRWLERVTAPGYVKCENGMGVAIGPNTERVLQCRTQIMKMTTSLRRISDHHYEEVEKPCGWEWSDWQDVPVVKE